MNILALDMATSTGWACWADGEVFYGTLDLSLKRGESAGMRFLRFGAWLRETKHLMDSVGIIVYEQAHHRGGPATQIAVGLQAKVLEYAAKIGAETMPVHAARLKKWATGTGNASKKKMLERAVQLGYEPKNDDEADALLLLSYAKERLMV